MLLVGGARLPRYSAQHSACSTVQKLKGVRQHWNLKPGAGNRFLLEEIMEKKKPARGNKSFTKSPKLQDGKLCNLKRHFKLCAREVVGYLDNMAAKDPERFVWAGVPAITRNCNLRRKEKKQYHQRQVGNALNLLRRRLVLSARVERLRGGVIRQGWILSHHDAVTVEVDGYCDFIGQSRWEREIETEKDSTGAWRLKKIGPIVHPTVQRAVHGSVQRKSPSVHGSVQRSLCTLQPQPTDDQTSCKIEARPSLSASSSLPAASNLPAKGGTPQNGVPVKKAAEEEDAEKTKLTKWIFDNFNLMGAIGKSRVGLDRLVATHGAALVLAALNSFYNRPGDFGGVKNAWALFLSEADDHIANVKHTQERFMEAEARNKAAADRHAQMISQQMQAAENWKRLTTPGKMIGKDGKEIIECDVLAHMLGLLDE